MEHIDKAGSGFRSLTESIDTTTPAGPMMMQMVGAFAELEREMSRECIKAGLQAARDLGRIGGRPSKAERGVRFFFRVAKGDDGEFAPERSYICVENVSGNKSAGADKSHDKSAIAEKFLRMLSTYHRVGFCPRTRVLMCDAALSESRLKAPSAQIPRLAWIL
ncbi:MAG: recombinase family protein [Myxococcales bacterium]|nr:recombinase family protein [Myxococcales bacterium]USN51894.1 MAG: recombinase family protein [Myxococcales bacterium]